MASSPARALGEQAPVALPADLPVHLTASLVADLDDGDAAVTSSLAAALAAVPDARDRRGRGHELTGVLTVSRGVGWRLSFAGRMRVMAAPRKSPDGRRGRATRMGGEARRDPATKPGALARIGEQLGINPETLRNWVTQAEIDEGARPGTTTSDAERIAALERENRELRRANAILKSASAFFAAELDRPQR